LFKLISKYTLADEYGDNDPEQSLDEEKQKADHPQFNEPLFHRAKTS